MNPQFSKKLRLKNLNQNSLTQLIKIKDIDISQNYLFNNKIEPENMKIINHAMFEYYLRDTNSKNIILIKNKDEKYNRNSMKRFRKLAELNKDIKFYRMYNTENNMEFLNKKYELSNTFPQVLIFNRGEERPLILSDNLFLKYSSTVESINEELHKNLNIK